MTDATANADQITYWNETSGKTWTELSDLLDRQLETLGLEAMAALDPKGGERLVDIGCGCGRTTLELAARVGTGGAVTGVDISQPMLGEARRRAAAAGVSQASFIEADAQTYAFEPAALDGVFSRFGVMFFADPTAAFANIRRALKPGGRLAFVCWRPLAENPWMSIPMAAAGAYLPPPAPPQPGAPGPFAFADAERVRGILGGAGFGDLQIVPFDSKIGGNPLEETLKLSLRVGPLGAALREHPDAAPKAIEAVRAALSEHLEDGQVRIPGAVWIVTARNR